MKVLKIKIGTAFVDGKSIDVFQDAWERKSKDGNIYYEIRHPIFVQEIKKEEIKEKMEA